MTTIRKIVTSKIDGRNANNTTDDEIRPFGEIAVYLDTQYNPDKLTLMMFDGVRTHLKSKVLAPGCLYGSDADAGDGSNADTIKLIPDAELFANGSNQYLVVDPTGGEPGHIHIRAGGTQDSSNADLYLGGELTCVRVSDTSDTVTIRTTNIGDPNITLDWSFQPDGNLYFPGIGNNRIGESEPGLVLSSDNSVVLQSNNNIVNTYEVEFIGYVSNGFGDSLGATLTVTEIVAGTITDGMTIYGAGLPPEGWTLTFGGVMEPQGSGGIGNYLLSGANLLISSQSFNNGVLAAGSQIWTFGTDGALSLPSNGVIKSSTYSGFSLRSRHDEPIDNLVGSNILISPGQVSINYQVEDQGVPTPGYQWDFNYTTQALDLADGGLKFADNTVQTTAYVAADNVTKVLGEWTVTAGTNTYSFTVPGDGTYIMWVKGNIPNGIITWNATASVSNTNVPAIGTQYAWNYTGGGSPIALTSLPDQIVGSAGTISTDATYAGTTSNRFDFGISNTSGSTQTIYYGYTKIS